VKGKGMRIIRIGKEERVSAVYKNVISFKN
jgi:hypothetical protein